MQAKEKMLSIDWLKLLDGQCYVGPEYIPGRNWLSPQDLIALMDQHHVADAIVIHTCSMLTGNSTPQIGNGRLLDEVAGMDRLHPGWVLNPIGEISDEEKRVQDMLDKGVRVAMLYPKQMPILPWLFRNLLTVLEAHRVPVIVEFAAGSAFAYGTLDKQDWRTIYEIAKTYPRLPLIIGGMVGTGSWDAVLPLLRECKNVHFDAMHCCALWPDYIKKIGPQQFVWASRAPKYDPGMYVSCIQYIEGINDDARKLIAGDNLRLLMGQTFL